MLINLTNHPLDFWSEEQKNTAVALFGEVVDMPFPHIDPTATQTEIQALAQDYWQKIQQDYPTEHLVVHLMGEMCFCYALLQLLQENGITAVASTTERIVKELPHQQKIVDFRFIQFRRYYE